MKGAGFLDFLKKAHNFIKDNKLISRVAGVVGGIAPGFGAQGQAVGGVANAVGGIADQLGYGKRRKRRMAGGRKKTKRPHILV